MKRLLPLLVAVFIMSCHSEEKKDEKGTAPETSTTPPLYPATYSAKFEMGDAKSVETLMKLWKTWDDGDLSKSKEFFADTISLYLRDGSTMTGPRDSIVAGAQGYRSTFTSVHSSIHAIFPVRSTDKDENWACVWGTEVSTDKMGKTDSVDLQETWRFNKQGKANLLYQFGRVIKPDMK